MKKSVFFALIFIAIGFAEGLLNNDANMLWYDGLNKSALTPPSWVFPVMWTLLYALLGVICAKILKTPQSKNRLLSLFAFQMVLNFLWSPMFFAAQQPLWALVIILLMSLSLLLILLRSFNLSRPIFYMFLPYSLWVFFAAYLNLYVVLYN